jgi:hypothetical protein
MISERERRVEWRGLAGSLLGVLAVASIALASLGGGSGHGTNGLSVPARALEERSLAGRLAAIEEAVARRDATRAIFEWRDAYAAALGSRRWEAMVSVGDAAVKIDGVAGRATGGQPTGFRAEARQAYLRALFDARAAGSDEGIQRVASAFAALGDAEMAARARSMTADRR